ncbi:MAG: DUF5052 family protein [Agathobacter sp.]|nr:DUF5052 family protein [Agathobacter sp.]
MKKRGKLVVIVALVLVVGAVVTGCGWAGFGNSLNELTGSIKGNTYECQFYSNSGELFMTAEGKNIKMSPNIVDEYTYSGDRWAITETMSSVITITIDGKQIESCGSTVLFVEKGLKPDVEFDTSDIHISSDANGIGDMTIVAETVNKYKNYFGKETVVVIQSQLGDPICAYSGDDVYWEVSEDLPKTTKLMVDGKALYIHRANFQIIDKELLE